MQATIYENIIKAAFECGRTPRHGANANIFRGLERASIAGLGDKQVDQYTLGVKVGTVSAFLRSALHKVIAKNENNEDFILKINKCLDYLNEPSLKKIDKCLEEASEAFDEIGLIVKY